MLNTVEEKALLKCMPILCKNLHLTEILVHLQSSKTLTNEQVQEIEAESVGYKRNKKLIDFLMIGKQKSFPEFIDVLRNTNQEHLAALLEKAMNHSDIVSPDGPLSPKSLSAKLKCLYKDNRTFNPLSQVFIFDIEKDFIPLSFSQTRYGFKICEKFKQNVSFMGVPILPINKFERHLNDENADQPDERLLPADYFGPFSKEWKKGEVKYRPSSTTEGIAYDQCQLVNNAFKNGNHLLLIEGAAATGKTSLMRRIAYDWAKNEELKQYALVLLIEFRDVQGRSFEKLIDLVVEGMKWTEISSHTMEKLVVDTLCTYNHLHGNDYGSPSHENAELNRVLVLLDGYDEAVPRNPCAELEKFFANTKPTSPLLFDVVITTRPAYLTNFRRNCSRLVDAEILGFMSPEQKRKFIEVHFRKMCLESSQEQEKVNDVLKCIEKHEGLKIAAETPLLLLFICLVHENLGSDFVFELYLHTIWWLIDRYQKEHHDLDIPLMCNCTERDENKMLTIQNKFINFPLVENLGKLSFEMFRTTCFTKENLKQYGLFTEQKETAQNPNCASAKIGLMNKEETIIRVRTEQYYVFPHRTIQEFLAGGYFYFWPKALSMNSSLLAEIFERGSMTEIELFVWEAMFLALEPRNKEDYYLKFREYFELYRTLVVDFSKMTRLGKYLLPIINNGFSKCSYVTNLTLNVPPHSTSIQLNNMVSLQSLKISGILFKEFSKQILLPSVVVSITLEDCEFSSADSYVTTFVYLSKKMEGNVSLKLINCTITLCETSGIEHLCLTTKTPFDFITRDHIEANVKRNWWNEISTLVTSNQVISFHCSCFKLSKLKLIEYRFTESNGFSIPSFTSCEIVLKKCTFENMTTFFKTIQHFKSVSNDTTTMALKKVIIVRKQEANIKIHLTMQPMSNYWDPDTFANQSTELMDKFRIFRLNDSLNVLKNATDNVENEENLAIGVRNLAVGAGNVAVRAADVALGNALLDARNAAAHAAENVGIAAVNVGTAAINALGSLFSRR